MLALLEAGADFNIENQNSSLPPIVAAASEGYTPVVKAFLDFGESPDKSSSAGGMSALIFAALRGYVATMRLLLDRGANPDQRDDVACTALMRAAAEGRLDSVRCLVEYGRADWTLASMVRTIRSLCPLIHQRCCRIICMFVSLRGRRVDWTRSRGPGVDFTCVVRCSRNSSLRCVQAETSSARCSCP